MKYFIIICLLLAIGCKKDETELSKISKDVRYTVQCDSCNITIWENVNGQSILTDTTAIGGFSTSFVSDAPATLALSIKFEDYSKDTFPVTASIYVNEILVASNTGFALNYGTIPLSKNWVFTQYVLAK